MKDNELFTFKLVEGFTPDPSEKMRICSNGALWIQRDGNMYEAIPQHDGVSEAITAEAYKILHGENKGEKANANNGD